MYLNQLKVIKRKGKAGIRILMSLPRPRSPCCCSWASRGRWFPPHRPARGQGAAGRSPRTCCRPCALPPTPSASGSPPRSPSSPAKSKPVEKELKFRGAVTLIARILKNMKRFHPYYCILLPLLPFDPSCFLYLLSFFLFIHASHDSSPTHDPLP